MADPSKNKSEEPQRTQPDVETAERFIQEKHIGERIRRLRLKKSMGLVELGRQAGLSASFLSQLETGRVVPTLRNLARIAMVFAKDLSYFFDSEPTAVFRVHKHSDRVRIPQTGVEHPTYLFESLGYQVPDRQMDPYFAEFLPSGENAEPKPHIHSGFEFLYVLNGELCIRHSTHAANLSPGDSAYFDSGTPHSYQCVGNRPAEAIIVTMHQATSGQPQRAASAPAQRTTAPVAAKPVTQEASADGSSNGSL